MGSYTGRDARLNWRELFGEVRRGEHPLVTFHDAPLMRCVPAEWYEQVLQTFRDVADLADFLSRDPETLSAIRETLNDVGDLAPPGRKFGELGTLTEVLSRSPEELRFLCGALDSLRRLAPPPAACEPSLREAG